MMENFYRNLIDSSPFGYAYHKIIYDENGNFQDYVFLDVNSTFEDYTQLNKQDILGKRATEVIPDIKKSEFDWISFYGNIVLNKEKVEIEQYSEHLKKCYRIFAHAIDAEHFVTFFMDITEERKKIEEKTAVLTALNDIVFDLDKEFKVKNIIISKKEFLFFPKERIIGKSLKELFSKDTSELFMDSCKKAVKSGKKEFLKYKSPIKKDNKWLEASISYLKDFKNEKYIVSIRDISHEKNLERKIAYENQKLSTVIEGTATGTWEWNILADEVKINDRCASIIGYDKKELMPLTREKWKSFLHPDDLKKVEDALTEHLKGNTDYYSAEFRMKHKRGFWVWVLDKGKMVKVEECDCPTIFGTCQDVSNYKRLEKELKSEKNMLKTTLLSIGEAVISIDLSGKVLLINHVAEKLTGFKRAEAVGKNYKEIFPIYSENLFDKNYEIIDSILWKNETIDFSVEAKLASVSGDVYPIEFNASPIKNKEGLINGAVIVFRDITDRKNRQDEILYLSYHDQLTGLYNRRFFEEELKRLDTERNLPISLIMIDVNGLKLTNDAFGHAAGDTLLTSTSKIMHTCCRADDIIARIGGDEFAILLPQTSLDDARKIVERIYKKMSEEKLEPILLSASLGLGTKTIIEENIVNAMKRAEDDMYKKKLNESKVMREKTLKKVINIFFSTSKRGKTHSLNVSKLSVLIGEAMGLDEKSLNILRELGLVHDIGLIAVDTEDVEKKTSLTESEWLEVKRHSELGYQILKSVNHMVPIAEYVLSHHERWDGTGYPNGLKKDEIPLASRILTVADAYDAMTSERSYKASISKAEAIEELEDKAGTQFDPEVVKFFVETLKKRDL